MHDDFTAHFGQLADNQLRAAVPGIAHILPVRCTQQRNSGGCHDLAHIPQGIANQLGYMQGTGVVDVDGTVILFRAILALITNS
jgi:hypothetical protein